MKQTDQQAEELFREQCRRQMNRPLRDRIKYGFNRVHKASQQTIATSDGIVLDRCRQWVNLSHRIITGRIEDAWLLDLSAGPQ